jgi:effector-binding domain-containing protein
MTDVAERRAGTGVDVSVCELPPRRAATVRIAGSTQDLPALMARAFADTSRAITAAGARFSGHPFARYTAFGERIEAIVGFPFVGELPGSAGIDISELPGGRAAMVRHVGPYEEIGRAWAGATAYLEAQGLTPTGPAWESYLTGPEDPGPPITEIFWPLD